MVNPDSSVISTSFAWDDESKFKFDEFYCGFGEDHLLDEAIVRMHVNIYTVEISPLRSLENQKGRIEQS